MMWPSKSAKAGMLRTSRAIDTITRLVESRQMEKSDWAKSTLHLPAVDLDPVPVFGDSHQDGIHNGHSRQ